VTTGWFIVWLGLLGAIALVAIAFWRQLIVLRREVHQLATDGILSREVTGTWIIKEIHQDLKQIAKRQLEIAQQIADEEFSLRTVLASMAEGVLISDANLRIRLTNERLQQMFSLAHAPVNRTVMEVFRNHLLHQVIQQTLQSAEPRSAELQVEILDAGQFQTKHFQVTSVRLCPRDRESLAGALVIFHDVSKIRTLEAVRKEFVANVSHELRTPLSIITGYLETMIEGGDDYETNLRFLKTMHKHAQRLNLLVEDLLTISQLESRKVSFHFEPVDLFECVTRVIERLDTRIREIDALVTVNVPKHLSQIEGDAFRIDQALFNLVDNALKHGGKRGVKIRVDAWCDGSDTIIGVHDNGPGIPLSDQPHIFERFYRVHKDRSRDAGGTGLGLSIVKHTVQAHGGSVALESAPGAGARFLIKLPIRQN
jgi:two-component system, OmpR family, phosphate regulon sensor histidine kinase PhoR